MIKLLVQLLCSLISFSMHLINVRSSSDVVHLLPPDPTLTVNNVNHIMEKVEPKVKAQVWVDARVAPMEQEKMKEVCRSGKEDECADLYVNYNPCSSWERLARSLYRHHQLAALEEVRSYLPPRGQPGFTHVTMNVHVT